MIVKVIVEDEMEFIDALNGLRAIEAAIDTVNTGDAKELLAVEAARYSKLVTTQIMGVEA